MQGWARLGTGLGWAGPGAHLREGPGPPRFLGAGADVLRKLHRQRSNVWVWVGGWLLGFDDDDDEPGWSTKLETH